MNCDDVGFATSAEFMDVVKDGLAQIDEGEGFEYIVGKVKGGELKVVFEPKSKNHECHMIDGVDGLGYILAFDKVEQNVN